MMDPRERFAEIAGVEDDADGFDESNLMEDEINELNEGGIALRAGI